MAHLKYYMKERIVFSEANQMKLDTNQEITIVFKKLIRHFKVGRTKWSQPILRFGRKNCANSNFVKVMIPSNFLILCHEVAHVKHIREVKNKISLREMQMGKKIRYHGKRHFRIMKSMIKYCEKKKWFEQEIIRMTHQYSSYVVPSPFSVDTHPSNHSSDIPQNQGKLQD